MLAIKLEGCEPFRLDDLPIADFQKIARKHGISWASLLNAPAQDPDAMADLVDLVADRNGVPRPARPTTVREAMSVLNDLLVFVEDDLPTEWQGEDAGPSFPPEAGEPATTS